MVELRPYQKDMVARTYASLHKHQRVVMQAPTGAGKTVMAWKMMHDAQSKGKSSYFLVHRNELLAQTSKSFWRNKLQHGLIASGKSTSPSQIQLCSVGTLVNRLHNYKDHPALLIIDEGHRSLAASYMKVIEHYHTSKVVCLTATPERTDGRGLGSVYEDLIQGVPIRYLIDIGSLCDYELFGVPAGISTDGVSTRGGDYDTKQLSTAVNKPKITGDAIKHYKALAYGRKTVVMCVDVKHAEDVAAQYCAAGIPAKAIHSGSKNREQILTQFENDEFLVLVSVELLIEGYDEPSISCVQWLRPTKSRIVWMQGNGRGLRPHDSKDFLLILDHANNRMHFGLPCDPYEWSLLDRSKRRKASGIDEQTLSVQDCSNCSLSFRSGVSICPHCGTEVPFKKRVLIYEERDLERIKAIEIREQQEKERKQKRREQGQSRSIADLVKIGVDSNYKNPAYWAARVFASRDGNRPHTKQEYLEARNIEMQLRSQ